MPVKPAHLLVAALFALSALSGCGDQRDVTSPSATTGAPSSKHQVQCGATDPALAQLAQARGKTVGTAYRSTYAANDPCYRTVALAEFNSLTTEIGTMMNTVQPAPGTFDFREADAVADLAAKVVEIELAAAAAS